MKPTYCLGIESTAHTFGAAIVTSDGKVLSNEKLSFKSEDGGIHPREASEFHLKNAKTIIGNALQKANVKVKDLGLIVFAQGPGLGPCLKNGAIAARSLAVRNNIPLLGVNHPIGHIEIARLMCQSKDPIIVYTSGANTQIIGYESGKYRVFGETLDIGIGNLLDTFGRKIGLGFPAGPKMDEMYFQAKKLIPFPYSVKGMDLVFSGLLTFASQKVGKETPEDLSYSLMHTAYAMITEVTERALAHTEKKEVLLTGGVAASKSLQKMLQEMCDQRGAKLLICPREFATDNAAMIAWTGILAHQSGTKMKMIETKINQKFRSDQVEVSWINEKSRKK